MALNGKQAYALAKKYTNDTVIGLGGIKGKNCIIQSAIKTNGITDVIFQWTDDNEEVQTTSIQVADGKDDIAITNVDVNEFNHLICMLSDGTIIDAGEIAVSIKASEMDNDLGLTKVENSTSNGNIKIDGVETTVYTLPTLTKSSVGLENVDNTSDANKPVSTATQTALNTKASTTTLTTHTGNADIHVTAAEKTAWNTDIATLRLALGTKIYGIRIDKQDTNPDTRVTYLYDAVGMTPAYMDFGGGSFSYGSWADIWFVKNNRPVALKFDGTVDYELDHTDFTKKLDGTASDVSAPDYGGNFMSEMPAVYVKRWEDSRYNYIAFSDKQVNSDFLAQAHTNAYGTVNSAIYLPMFKGWKDSNNKLRSLMGTYPTGNTTGTNEVTYASNNGTGWQIWDKAKIDLIMDLIMLITKSTNCRAKIGNGDCNTYNASDTTNYGKMKSGYETDGTTRSASAQFYGSEGPEVTDYGKHHMIAFYIEDLWANRSDRCLGFNLVDNVYKVKMTAPYVLDSDSSYGTLTVAPPSEGWLKNVSSANAYGEVPTEVGASNTSGFANYFYKTASGSRLSLFGGNCTAGLKVGRYWILSYESSGANWHFGGSPCYNNPS